MPLKRSKSSGVRRNVQSVEVAEEKVAVADEWVVEAEKELCEAETCALEAEQEFRSQKERADHLSRDVIRSAIKFKEASEWVATMH